MTGRVYGDTTEEQPAHRQMTIAAGSDAAEVAGANPEYRPSHEYIDAPINRVEWEASDKCSRIGSGWRMQARDQGYPRRWTPTIGPWSQCCEAIRWCEDYLSTH